MRTPAKRAQRFNGWVGARIGAALAVAACDLAGGGVDSDLDEDGGVVVPDGGARFDGAVAPEEDGGGGEDDGGD